MYAYGSGYPTQFMSEMYSSAPIYIGFPFVQDNSYFAFNTNHFE